MYEEIEWVCPLCKTVEVHPAFVVDASHECPDSDGREITMEQRVLVAA